jgi:glycosyltransferase involved in cell wall biosynthesis
MNNFTVIMPIHNEELFLPLSLPSVFELIPSEVILFFDRCIDDSIEVARKIAKSHNMLEKTQFVEVYDDIDGFNMRFAFMRWLGCKYARNNIILITASDLILDQKISNYLNILGKDGVALISFLHKDYPIDFRNLLKRLLVRTKIRGLGQERWLGPIMMFNKNIAFKLENIDSLKKLDSAEDTHLHQAITSRYRSLCVASDTIHLRPRFGSRDYLRGQLYWRVAHRGFVIVFLNCLFMFRLNLIKGYIHERYGK